MVAPIPFTESAKMTDDLSERRQEAANRREFAAGAATANQPTW
jgi:hypothetical protein